MNKAIKLFVSGKGVDVKPPEVQNIKSNGMCSSKKYENECIDYLRDTFSIDVMYSQNSRLH